MPGSNDIGSYIKALFPTAQLDFEIGNMLDCEIDKEQYQLWISERARSIAVNNPRRDGERNYKRVLNLLGRLTEYRGCDTGISRTLWSALHTIAKILAHAPDWANFETGPMFGGRNATIADRLCLSVDRTKKILSSLRSFGLIVHYHRHANGRRWIRRNSDGSVSGHGFSLLPIIVMLDELEEHVARWIQLHHEAARLQSKIKGHICSFRQSLRAAHGDDWRAHPGNMQCQKILGEAMVAKRQSDVESLKAILTDLDFASDAKPKINPPERQKWHPTPKPSPERIEVTGEPKGRSNDGSADTDYGLEQAKLDENEIPVIFPNSALYLQMHRNWESAVEHLARDTTLSADTWHQMQRTLGKRAASISVMIIAERLASGEIRATPTAYAKGMLNAARRGDLQLGRTIWGRRELLAA